MSFLFHLLSKTLIASAYVIFLYDASYMSFSMSFVYTKPSILEETIAFFIALSIVIVLSIRLPPVSSFYIIPYFSPFGKRA